jgi:hypothetical protein
MPETEVRARYQEAANVTIEAERGWGCEALARVVGGQD